MKNNTCHSLKDINNFRDTPNSGICKKKLTINHLSSYPGDSDDKECACKAGDPGSIPRSGRSPGEGTIYHVILCCRLKSCGPKKIYFKKKIAYENNCFIGRK